jgi:hypothetical protein
MSPPPTTSTFPDGHADYLWSLQDDSSFESAALRSAHADRRPASFDDAEVVWLPCAGAAGGAGALRRARLDCAAESIRNAFPAHRGSRRVSCASCMPSANLAVVEPDWQSPLLADYHEWHDCGHFRRSLFDQLIAPHRLAGDWLRVDP